MLCLLALPALLWGQTPVEDVVTAITGDGWTVPDTRIFSPGDLGEAPVDADLAEVIRAYGFRRLGEFQAARSTGEVDGKIYEMTDSAAAFGLFGYLRDRRANDFRPGTLGTESFHQDGRLHVWQANHVLVLSGARAETEALARTMTAAIFGDSRKPPVSAILPQRFLVPDSETYLLDRDTFATVTRLDPVTLGFDNSVEVAVGEYEDDGESIGLAMLLYPTSHLAARYEEQWVSTDRPLPAYTRSGPALGIVLDGVEVEESALARSVLGDVIYRSELTWNESLPDPLTLPNLILTIFAWIGIALLFTTVAGIAFGGVRIYMKTRYPERFLGTSPGAEYIQLRLNQSLTDGRGASRPALEAQTKQNQ